MVCIASVTSIYNKPPPSTGEIVPKNVSPETELACFVLVDVDLMQGFAVIAKSLTEEGTTEVGCGP